MFVREMKRVWRRCKDPRDDGIGPVSGFDDRRSSRRFLRALKVFGIGPWRLFSERSRVVRDVHRERVVGKRPCRFWEGHDIFCCVRRECSNVRYVVWNVCGNRNQIPADRVGCK
ncbi:hypothetical protein BCR33DRAFT_127345 [Rhizoclosmatium globosum]|uniref:Uncharacterized protein n=1 Tax=Rhizoclosmatium globosum TaxID=329046 RepID=A0A1Y2CH32_9FUNG|nr:hypothetical protein BCR33DRAFT_127345 [Rhizoclosmatium globosum]|eukprot:ORY46353.1 hypothetical protein BCR33DRAFT_127345 [Rhizoclosmatium globosum]